MITIPPDQIATNIEPTCFSHLLNKLAIAKKDTPCKWVETTEDVYDMYKVAVPPRVSRPDCFLCGEASHYEDNCCVYIAFCIVREESGMRYFSKYMTFKEFMSFYHDQVALQKSK